MKKSTRQTITEIIDTFGDNPFTVDDLIKLSNVNQSTVRSIVSTMHSTGVLVHVDSIKIPRGRSRILFRKASPELGENKEADDSQNNFDRYIAIVQALPEVFTMSMLKQKVSELKETDKSLSKNTQFLVTTLDYLEKIGIVCSVVTVNADELNRKGRPPKSWTASPARMSTERQLTAMLSKLVENDSFIE